ncbi:uracil-DNA glycosylase family protein [Tianweitania populi]|uniref:Type-4 uracil-DNA glycosylase n=1 Tax=Tianweitania populi TaxID=1607949 RepID=A0A8J3GIA1_9HYPH|nr:uracil-DNA glycosylase [Tianweitania populi]GHD06639.1 uracil-DNA glycosylase [Tianweitania populi]
MPDRIDADIEALLRFYADAGYSDALDDEPHDRFAESAKRVMPHGDTRAAAQSSRPSAPAAVPVPAAPIAAAPLSQPTIPAEAQAARARELARSASNLEELRGLLDSFDGCNLKFTAKQMVFSDGNPEAPIMFIGEAPGRDEDLEGRPFVGRSGQLLDRMLAAIGLDRDSVYIANVIPWRPPGNRDPSPLETEICRPFIERQIELAAPQVIVTLGNPSAKVILQAKEGIMRIRGSWKVHQTPGGMEIPAMPTLHPAYLLRNPAHKKLAWRDFLEIKARLKSVV